jgi:tetratricopeptide (TPR) repeat protein
MEPDQEHQTDQGAEGPTDGLVSLYTTAMLAELAGVKAPVIRRWTSRGWLRAKREVRRLLYFEFSEVATARRLAELHAAGVSAAEIERSLLALSRYVPHIQRPLAELSLVLEGKQLLVRQGEELVEASGQRRFDFSMVNGSNLDSLAEADGGQRVVSIEKGRKDSFWDDSPRAMLLAAERLEEDGELTAAADTLRTVLAAGGPNAEVNFNLAEVLYQLGDLSAARERYYCAIELDEDYVEARANLGCVLAETGEYDLAVAAFRGALRYHAQYADVHYHLARALDEMGKADAAEEHWKTFLQLSPTSPWADEARLRLEG